MSEQTYEVDQSSTKDGGSRQRLLLAVAAGVVLLGLAWFFLLQPMLFGDDAVELDASTAAVDEGAALPEPVVVDEVVSVALPTVTYDVFLDRDPFEPVVEEVVEAAPVEGGDPTDPNAPPIDPELTPLDPALPVPILAPGESACSGEDEMVCAGQVLTLLDTSGAGEDAVAVIQVDTTVYEATPGMRFAGNLVLRSVDQDCANLSYGDETFRLCTGARVMK